MLFQRIADEHADIDPDDLKRAPFVAKALTAVAIYVRDGLPEIALKPDEQRAVEYLRHAATFFNEPDAQFELAKMLIRIQRQTSRRACTICRSCRRKVIPARRPCSPICWRAASTCRRIMRGRSA